MSALFFRKIEKTDLEDVFVLLNQLKEKDVDSLDKDSSWKNFTSNTSVNSIVEILGVISLFGFLNRWNDSMGTPIEDGALESGNTYLEGWNPDKHVY